MYCSNCGAKLEGDPAFCPNCGSPLKQTVNEGNPGNNVQNDLNRGNSLNQNINYGAYQRNAQNPENTYGTQYQGSVPRQTPFQQGRAQYQGGNQPYQRFSSSEVLPMKWYKFVIWVQLFLGAIGNFGTGVMTLTGMNYGENRELVYAFYGGMRVLDIIMGLWCIFMSFVAIYIRQQMAHFKTGAPSLYLTYLVVVPASTFLYALIASAILSANTFSYQNVIPVVTGGVMAYLCNIYFNKRANLFCN